jgi:hypothetical protein
LLVDPSAPVLHGHVHHHGHHGVCGRPTGRQRSVRGTLHRGRVDPRGRRGELQVGPRLRGSALVRLHGLDVAPLLELAASHLGSRRGN